MRNLHRMKSTTCLRELVRVPELHPSNLVMPLFISASEADSSTALPGVSYLNVLGAVREVTSALQAGISSFMVFVLTEQRSKDGSAALDEKAFPNEVFAHLKSEFGESANLIADLCLCAYTDSRSCALCRDDRIDLEASNAMLTRLAVSHVEAGASMVAPAGMLHGQVGAIREGLDASGHWDVPIMSYVKADSVLYEPYAQVVRKGGVAHSLPSRTRRLEISNNREFFDRLSLDIEQGADILIVKPAITNLDIISYARRQWNLPIAAYQVSGEYAMIKAASHGGYLEERPLLREMVSSIARSGADVIVSYYALEIAAILKDQR